MGGHLSREILFVELIDVTSDLVNYISLKDKACARDEEGTCTTDNELTAAACVLGCSVLGFSASLCFAYYKKKQLEKVVPDFIAECSRQVEEDNKASERYVVGLIGKSVHKMMKETSQDKRTFPGRKIIEDVEADLKNKPEEGQQGYQGWCGGIGSAALIELLSAMDSEGVISKAESLFQGSMCSQGPRGKDAAFYFQRWGLPSGEIGDHKEDIGLAIIKIQKYSFQLKIAVALVEDLPSTLFNLYMVHGKGVSSGTQLSVLVISLLCFLYNGVFKTYQNYEAQGMSRLIEGSLHKVKAKDEESKKKYREENLRGEQHRLIAGAQ